LSKPVSFSGPSQHLQSVIHFFWLGWHPYCTQLHTTLLVQLSRCPRRMGNFNSHTQETRQETRQTATRTLTGLLAEDPRGLMESESCESSDSIASSCMQASSASFYAPSTPFGLSSTICNICFEREEAPGRSPYHCRHNVCTACLLKMQQHRQYACPFCREPQKSALPSIEFKLLKLLVGVDVSTRLELISAIRAVQRGDDNAALLLDKKCGDAIQRFTDFGSQHVEAEPCLRLIVRICDDSEFATRARALIAVPSN